MSTPASETRVQLTARQAEWLTDLEASGSEAYAKAADAGLHIEVLAGIDPVLVIPPAAADWIGLAVGIRADIADEGEYSTGERMSVLGLARKLAAAGITKAAPLTRQP